MNITNKGLIRRGIAAAYMFILLASTVTFAVANPLELKSADAQVQDDCPKLPIRNVVASGEENSKIGNVASNAIDMNAATRWSNFGKGSFIQADLGHSAVLCTVDILWLYGDSRVYNFVISVSNDGTFFNDIASARSTGETSSAERYKVPEVTARYVRITVFGNNVNDWTNISELAINGQECTAPRITSSPSAIGSQEGNVPQNTLDNSINTRWSNLGFPSWIQYDLGDSQPICSVDVAWYRGDLRVNRFTISVSNDGINFRPIFSGQSSGKTTGLESYNVPDTIGQYMRITVTGNTENSWSSITEVDVNAGFPPRPTPTPTECKTPTITAVGATGNDGNIPQNTLDNNANTRWSNPGLPSSIQYDLGGTSHPICDVDIAWYRGNLRVNSFTISASDDPSFTNPKTIFIGQSSGKTTSPETYNVEDTSKRYLRITVTANTENDWASITEVKINAKTSSPSPEICGNGIDDDDDGQIDEGCTPVEEICGNGIDDNDDGRIDEGCTSGGDEDPFGIEKIYPTKSGGEEWFMDMKDGKDPRSSPPSMTKNSDGSFKVKSSKVRYGAFTTSGYDQDKIETLNHATIARNGYMQSPNDWRDVEMTGYVKVNNGDSAENFAFYARGGRHTGDGNPEGCEGSAYKGDLGYDGRVRFAKEQWHVSYVFTDHKRAMSSIEDKWVGLKSIMYNMEQNGETVVKMEIWLDKNEDGKQDGPWVKVDENIDDGGWGSSGRECGGEPDQIITWGGPVATFRWDGATDVDIKNFSVREIRVPS
jgi:hypothetical protein